jgi:hypothetical protein
MFSKPGTIFALLAVLIAGLAIHLDFTPAPVNNAPSDTSFSVQKAYAHLRQIANKPHSIGTSEKERVRNYIVAQCQALGLVTQTQHSTSVVSYATGVRAGDVTNVIALYKGSDSARESDGARGSDNASVSDSASPSKSAVLVMAHYDSEPNAIGAGDDGAGCAAMLETARLLKKGPLLHNDVIFLFTDGEEAGLLGSTSFVRENPLFPEVGVALNFDGRGNAGKSFMISNGSSGWIVDEYRRACAHKNASSLYHELFRILPNSTDLLPFSKKGIPGFDFAYIDGFVNYHAMTDRPENMDRNTLQEQGDNMLSLVRRFGRIDIRRRIATESSFFNVLGNWMIGYPVSWNSVFLVLTNLLFLAGLITGMVNRRIRWKGLLAGFFSFAVVLTLLYFVTSFSLQGVRAAYPLYGGYYSNAYNSKYFYFAIIALVIAVFTFIYQFLLRKWELPSLLAGIALLEVVVLDLLYKLIPTAIYFLCFPLLFLLIFCLIRYSKRSGIPAESGEATGATSSEESGEASDAELSTESGTESDAESDAESGATSGAGSDAESDAESGATSGAGSGAGSGATSGATSGAETGVASSPASGAAAWRGSLLLFIFLLPALLLLAPLIYGLFIGFDVQPLAAALGPLTGLLLGLLVPLLAASFRESRWLLPGSAFLLCLLATGFGVLQGRAPGGVLYKTDLRYVVNSDDSSARWVLRSTSVDSWNRKYLPHPVTAPSVYNFGDLPGGTAQELVDKADFVNFSPPDVTVVSDSVTNGVRKLRLHCMVFDSAVSAHFDLDSTCPALDIAVNGVRAENQSDHSVAASVNAQAGSPKYRWLDVSGMWPDGFDLLFELNPKIPFRCHAISRIMGLPAIQGFQGFPSNRIPGPGVFSNTTMSSKYYQFAAP